MFFASTTFADDMRRVVTGLDEKNHAVVLLIAGGTRLDLLPEIVATNFLDHR